MRKHVDLIEDAVKVLREMPVDMQTNAARVIIDYAAGEDLAAAR